jgi:serine/threonine protein kinase
LESVSVIHRDLAARNVLVGANPTDVKLADLGAARSVFRLADREYSATTEHKPARWMAPESLKQAAFTTKSDVWAFGVFCWEVTTLAKTPYGALGVKDMVDSINQGNRLEQAPFTPPGLYKQMLLCWSTDPKRRPNFFNLIHLVGAIRGALAVTADGAATLGWDNSLEQSTHFNSGSAGAEIDGGCTPDLAPAEVMVPHTAGTSGHEPPQAATAGASDGYEVFKTIPSPASDGYEVFKTIPSPAPTILDSAASLPDCKTPTSEEGLCHSQRDNASCVTVEAPSQPQHEQQPQQEQQTQQQQQPHGAAQPSHATDCCDAPALPTTETPVTITRPASVPRLQLHGDADEGTRL